MKRKNVFKKLLATGIIAVMAVGLAACGGGSSSEGSTAGAGAGAEAGGKPDTIRIGYWASPNSEIIVKETGTLEELYPDTDVKWVEFTSGADILTAIQSDSIDLATIGTPPGTTGIANDYAFHVYYIEDIIGESEGLIVKNSSGIDSLQDLEGKTIATSFSTTSHFSLLQALEQEGIDKTKIKLTDMDASNIFAAWDRGDIDGAYIWESVKTQLLDADGKEIISSEQVAEKGSPTAEFGIVRDGFYEQYPDVIKDYIGLLDQATDTFNNDQENASKIISGALGLTDDETLKAMGEVTELSKEDQKTYIGTSSQPGTFADVLKKTADFQFEQGNLTESPDVSVFQDAILTELYD